MDALVTHGNRVRAPGTPFYQDRDGWRCDLVEPVDFALIERRFDLPPMVELSRAWGTVLDRDTWVVIEGGMVEVIPDGPGSRGTGRGIGATGRELSLVWFTDLVSRVSRQRLGTMGKPIGVKPVSRGGEWHFRTTAGNELSLEQVFQALQSSAAGQAWLRDEYEYPIRRAHQEDGRTKQRERDLVHPCERAWIRSGIR
ncbi:MAG: hypothetical protein H0X64_06525 [Gemmatimonadaceae bacterium]|nr:hypothetical protein [Gemmatimonadaceae bacterium]